MRCSRFGNILTSAISLDNQERSERKIPLFQRQKQWYLQGVKNHTNLPCLCFFFFLLFVFDVDHFQSLLKMLQYYACFMFQIFSCETGGILASPPGIEPTARALEGKVLTTGQPGKCPYLCFLMRYILFVILGLSVFNFFHKSTGNILILVLIFGQHARAFPDHTL